MLEDFIIRHIKAQLPFEPNEEKEALFKVLGHYLVSTDPVKAFILRGYAGTGKTSVVSALVRAMQQLQQQCVLLAPTGRAAKVLSKYSGFPAFTIHKYIYRQNRLGVEAFSLADNKHTHTLFIVDEGSMISASRDNATFGSGNLLDDLIRFIYQGQGCHLLLLGDNAQLPPVGSEESRALDKDYIAGFGLHVEDFTLTQVARQALDSGILSEATRLRQALFETEHSGSGGHFSVTPDGKDIIRLQGTEVVDQLERSYQEAGAEETLIITRSNKAANLYNQGVRARILWKEDQVSSGDRLMISKNNYYWTQEYEQLDFLANGDLVEIVRLRNEHEMYGYRFAEASLRLVDYDWEIDALIWIDTLFTDSPEANYEMQKKLYALIAEDYPEIKNSKERTKKIFESPYYNALQVRFAYAVTCHKAQGGQWRHIYLDPRTGTNPDISATAQLRWLYTALTRATEKLYLLR